MKKLLLTIITICLMFNLCACGNEPAPAKDNSSTVTVTEDADSTAKVAEPVAVAVGNTITLDFAEMTIAEAAIADDIRQSIKTGSITYTTGPSAKPDSEYIYIRGLIKNTSNATISSADIKGNVTIDKYTYDIKDFSTIESDGSSAHNLEPLMQYTYTMYAEVPNELAQNYQSCVINFGFNENFESTWSSDTIDSLPYLYALTLK